MPGERNSFFMKQLVKHWLFALAILAAGVAFLGAEEGTDARKSELISLAKRIKYQEGRINLGDGLATLNLPASYRYVDPAGTETILTGLWGNPPSKRKSLGMIVPVYFNPFRASSWCVILTFDDDGHISDSDAGTIDYTALLKDMKKGVEEASKDRVKQGYEPITLVGWATPPSYDRQTHKMYWAKELKFGGGKENTLNYNLRLLGRSGVLVLNAVSGMSQLDDIETATPEILGMIDFNPGQRYADYKPGTDKLATYGLAALIAGGVAAKTGLLKGLFLGILAFKKVIVVGVIAALAFIKKLFSKKPDE